MPSEYIRYVLCSYSLNFVACLITSMCLLRPGRGAHYYDQLVCLSVCLSLSVCPRVCLCWTDLHEILCAAPLWPWLGPPLALCTSGFTDDVTFGRNGRDAETWRLRRAATALSGVAIPGRSLMCL